MSDKTTDRNDQQQSHVYTEEAKQRHVSHWDLDYLPTGEIEEAYEEGSQTRQEEDPANEENPPHEADFRPKHNEQGRSEPRRDPTEKAREIRNQEPE